MFLLDPFLDRSTSCAGPFSVRCDLPSDVVAGEPSCYVREVTRPLELRNPIRAQSEPTGSNPHFSVEVRKASHLFSGPLGGLEVHGSFQGSSAWDVDWSHAERCQV